MSIPPLSLGGLASGIDTDSIVTQLMAIERQPRTRLSLEDTKAVNRQSVLNELKTRLGAVRDAANALSSTATWANTQAVTSSDAARIGVSTEAGTGAAPGTRVIEVSALAVTAQRAFTYTASASAQNLTIGAFSLAVDPDTVVADVAAAINDREDAPVSAVVAGGKLVLTSRTGGAAGAFSVDPSVLVTEDAAHARAGADAAYTLDGQARTSSSNVLTDAILGVTVTLKSTTSGPVSIGVADPGADKDGLTAKTQAFVTAYNGAVDFIRGKLTEKTVRDPTTTTDAVKGQFAGDTMLSGALASMRAAFGDLSDLGISTGAASGTATFSKDAIAGRLHFDSAKLATALAADPDAVRERLDVFSGGLEAAVAPVVGDGITSRLDGVSSERKRIADAMTVMDTRLVQREKQLRGQFAAMEAALAASQAAQAQLSAQLDSLLLR